MQGGPSGAAWLLELPGAKAARLSMGKDHSLHVLPKSSWPWHALAGSLCSRTGLAPTTTVLTIIVVAHDPAQALHIALHHILHYLLLLSRWDPQLLLQQGALCVS